MIKYPKIDSVFKRDDCGAFTNEFACPEFEYLYKNQWIWTEKIDGTNIRIGWDGENVEFGGRTDKAQIPAHLMEYLSDRYNALGNVLHPNTVLFGEGYGHKINKGGKYLPDSVGFILFDVWVDGWWLRREDVVSVACKLGISAVPCLDVATLCGAEDYVRNGFGSNIADCDAEGLVLKPLTQMNFRTGKPIMTKIKTKDFGRE